MPAGCQFVCSNEKCEYCGTGFAIIGPWPLGKIDDVLTAKILRQNKPFKASLEQLKAEGREIACIIFPNNDDIPMVGWRVQMFCPACKCIWDYDVMLENEEQTLEEALENSDIPSVCPKCPDTELMDFEEAIDKGIQCPNCFQDLRQERWFSNEKDEEHPSARK